jgi:hypothetical protein
MYDAPQFNDGRGRYPDQIAAAAPRGMRPAVKRAAEAERISYGEFIRRAVEERLSRVLGRGEHAHG